MEIRKVCFIGFLTLLVSVLLGSCGVNSNLMFKEAKEDISAIKPNDSIPLTPYSPYKIGRDDRIAFTLNVDGGSDIILGQAGLGEMSTNNNLKTYIVRHDGIVEFPVIGDVKVEGLTIKECEDTLEALYGKENANPYIQVQITNQRVVVFPGNGSDAKVIQLTNSNTTLVEVIAMAGGITDRGKASSIKIMRRVGDEREVYQVDLSTIDGLKYADMIMQANDYVYVEPTAELAKELSQDVIPVVSLLSTAFFIFATILTLK